MLDRAPYMGVSCPEANTITCDRVGLAVWLKHPAEGVEAEIDGRRFALDDRDWGDGRRRFAGFLQPAGLTGDGALAVRSEDGRWYGEDEVAPRVRLWIRHEGGRPLTTTDVVPLHAGWG